MKRYILCCCLFIAINTFTSLGQCLSGSYTIGAAPSNYTTIQSAVNALKNNGICGPVVMNIKSGTYYESLNIKPIPGASLLNTVVFKSALNDSSLVTIGWSGSFPNNQTILIDSADYITFEKITIQTQSGGQAAVLLKNTANSITIENCVLKALLSTSTGITRFSGRSDLFTLKNCRVQDFANAISFASSASFPIFDSGTVISNNVFISNYQTTIKAQYQKKISIENNKISGPASSSAGYYGVLIDSSNIDYCRKNEISYATNAPHFCMKISGCDGFLGTSMDISNNIMSASSGYSLRIEKSHNINLIHNTIHNKTFSKSIDFISNTGITNLNNIYYSFGVPIIYFDDNSQFIQSDYNLYFSSNNSPDLFYVDSTFYYSLTQIKDSINIDLHSISQDPYFISLTNFHLTPNISPSNMGAPSSIADDIDGDARDIVAPDIGADEFIRQGNQYDLRLMNLLTNSVTCYGDTNKVIIKVQNIGLDTVFSFKVNLSINNSIISPVTISDTLIGAEISTYTITPLYVFSYGNHKISATVSQPNNQTDQDMSNNTISNIPFSPMSLSGTYFIGSSGADFLSLRQAFDTLNKFGICGRINLLMQPGIYTDTLTLKDVPGNFNNRIIVSAANGDSSSVVLQDFATTNLNFHSIIGIAHSSNITFNKISFKAKVLNNLSLTSYYLVYIRNYTGFNPTIDSLVFTHCDFKGNNLTNDIIRMESNSKVYNFLINHNRFEDGERAVEARFTQFSGYFKNNICINNLEGFNLNNNPSSDPNNPDSIIVSDNYIYNQIDISANSPCLYLVNVVNSKVFNNSFIRKHGLGMAIDAGFKSKYFNNYIYTENSSVNFPYGVNILNCSKSYFVNNTVRGNMFNSVGYALNIEFCDSLRVLNNIFENQTSAATFSIENTTNLTMNNNCYSTAASPTFTYNGTGYNSLATWMALSSQDQNSYSHTPTFFADTGYQWINDPILDGNAQAISWLNKDIDSKTRTAAGQDIGAWENYTSSLVWPGDANNDLQVNSQDLYSIGLHYGDLGVPRDSISNLFVGHTSTPWNISQLNSWVDKKFADCNGDSIINMDDTLAINLNYGLIHTARQSSVAKTNSIADIYLTFNKSIYNPGDTVKGEIFLGSSSSIHNNLYGASFKLNYESNKVKSNSEKIKFVNSWIGNINLSKIKFTKIKSNEGFIDASTVRVTHTNVSGYGKIGELEFVIKDTISSNSISIDVVDPNKIDKDGVVTSLNGKHDSILVNPNGVVTDVKQKQFDGVSVYPNPTKDYVTIKFDGKSIFSKIELISLNGNILISKNINTNSYLLNLNEISAGLYVLKITNVNTTELFKLVVY